MKIAVISHISIDHICAGATESISIGGPGCYSGLTIRSLGHDLTIITKIGPDFHYHHVLAKKGLIISDSSSSYHPTTRFRIVVDGTKRKLFLLARCQDIPIEDVVTIETDASIVSPIINEVSSEVMEKVSQRSGFVFLDPQGLIRRVARDGSVYWDSTDIDPFYRSADAIKVDREEAFVLTGIDTIDALYRLKVDTSIMTIHNKTVMLHSNRLYEINTELINRGDSTGAGDIFTGAFTTQFIKDNDAQWALCYGVAAAALALKSYKVGLDKVPSKIEIQRYASELHDTVKVLT